MFLPLETSTALRAYYGIIFFGGTSSDFIGVGPEPYEAATTWVLPGTTAIGWKYVSTSVSKMFAFRETKHHFMNGLGKIRNSFGKVSESDFFITALLITVSSKSLA